jgi:hypothetical protein
MMKSGMPEQVAELAHTCREAQSGGRMTAPGQLVVVPVMLMKLKHDGPESVGPEQSPFDANLTVGLPEQVRSSE